jgi:TetR/AcrR family transcriptional regulator
MGPARPLPRSVVAMTSTRRMGSEDSDTRAALLDAAYRLLLREGAAAVTSRRVAAEAGLKPQLIHYYFRTMDDLFVAMVRRGAEHNRERQAEALASPRPMQALWEFGHDSAGAAFTLEVSGLAQRRPAIRDEFLAHAEAFRAVDIEAVRKALRGEDEDEGGDRADDVSPEAVAVLLSNLGRMLAFEEAIGLTTGHAELRALVERWLRGLDEGQDPVLEGGS